MLYEFFNTIFNIWFFNDYTYYNTNNIEKITQTIYVNK